MTEWREQHAAAVEHEIGELDKVLAELDNAEAIAETRRSDKLAAEIRAVASAVRGEQAAMRTEISELRRRPDEHVMPMSLTTRRPRRASSSMPEFRCGPDDIDESGGVA